MGASPLAHRARVTVGGRLVRALREAAANLGLMDGERYVLTTACAYADDAGGSEVETDHPNEYARGATASSTTAFYALGVTPSTRAKPSCMRCEQGATPGAVRGDHAHRRRRARSPFWCCCWFRPELDSPAGEASTGRSAHGPVAAARGRV